MSQKIKVAVLGSTGYVGLELINILSNHKNVLIKFLGSDSSFNKKNLCITLIIYIQISNLPILKIIYLNKLLIQSRQIFT